MKKLLLLITVLAVVGLVAGCAVIPMFVESDILSPKMEEARRRKTERIYQRGRILWVPNPEDVTEYERREHESKEPDGFRGIKFGTDISTLENMEFMRERIIRDVESKEWKTKAYVRKNEIMMLGDIPLSRVEYFFWEGKFVYAELVADLIAGRPEYMISVCTAQFGRPSAGGEAPAWVWKKTIAATDVKVETTKVGEGDLWERTQKASSAAMPKDMTWEESKFAMKCAVSEPVETGGTYYKGPLKLHIMTKEAAEHLGYRIKIKEKREKGEF